MRERREKSSLGKNSNELKPLRRCSKPRFVNYLISFYPWITFSFRSYYFGQSRFVVSLRDDAFLSLVAAKVGAQARTLDREDAERPGNGTPESRGEKSHSRGQARWEGSEDTNGRQAYETNQQNSSWLPLPQLDRSISTSTRIGALFRFHSFGSREITIRQRREILTNLLYNASQASPHAPGDESVESSEVLELAHHDTGPEFV